MNNPYRELVSSITPTEFEEYCLEILKGYAETEGLKEFEIEHDVKIPAADGTYQIDVCAKFVALGVEFKVIAECKRYSKPVSREKVAVLADKVRSLGAHKGILMSTSGFQTGAHTYAREHGIALIQILNRDVMHIINACIPENAAQAREIFLQQEWIRRMPEYYAYEYSDMDFPDKKVYPSKSVVESIRKKFALDFGFLQDNEG